MMTAIRLVPVVDGALNNPARLDRLARSLATSLRCSCEIDHELLHAAPSFDPGRRQYHSSQLLRHLAGRSLPPTARYLGVTPLDLFVPILTFVFGEAQLGGPAALVSWRRLDNTFYGLPDDSALLEERLLKESLHELGHTLGLRHCDDPLCVMASTHSVELMDEKDASFCPDCVSLLSKR
jgi:archaemetzincin